MTEDISKGTLEPNTDKSTTIEERSITPSDKANILRVWRNNANYSENYILRDPDDKMKTRSSLMKQASVYLISQMELKIINEAMKDESWVQAMKKELDKFERNQV